MTNRLHPAGHRTPDGVVLSVIAPCLNEEGNIDALVDRTRAVFDGLGISAELLLVDDGSTDRTWARIRDQHPRDERIRGVKHDENRGMEQAWRSGLAEARGELICLIDADLQNRPEDIEKLYRAYLHELPDMVQAVRHMATGPKRYRLFSRGLNLLLNAAFGTQLRDNKSGFVVCRRDVLSRILSHRFGYRYFQSFLGVSAHGRGFSILEVDTRFEQRHAGESFLGRFPIGVSLRIVWELLKFRVEVSLERGSLSWLKRLRRAPRMERAPRSAQRRGADVIPPGLAGTASGKV